jgi:hypothetical protein
MSDYEDIDEWAAAVDQHRGGATTCSAGDGLTLVYRHSYPGGRPRTTLGISDRAGLIEVRPLAEDFTRRELASEARLLIAEVHLRTDQSGMSIATRRMLISRHLVQSARAYALSSSTDVALPMVIRAGGRAGLTREQMIGILADAYRGAGSRLPRPEGWETTLAEGQVDRALAEEPGELEEERVREALAGADAIVSSEEGRDLMRAVDEAMAQEQATAAAIRRRDEAIRSALAAGMSQRQVARATGLSHQRVAQIAHADEQQ